MSPAVLDEKVEKFQDMLGSTKRVGVSEFARSKSWRDKLPETGCFEVVDRSGVVGYMLAPDYAEAINDKIINLQEQVEKAQIFAMFLAREDRTNLETGAALTKSALSYFDETADELMGIINGD